MEQLLLHLFGDYVIQSDWMASEKTTKHLPAAVHALTYTLPFILITQCVPTLFLIFYTHYMIDRYRLARYVCWFKNLFSPKRFVHKWEECSGTSIRRNHE